MVRVLNKQFQEAAQLHSVSEKCKLKSLWDHQPRWDAWDKRSDLVHGEDLEGSGGEGGGRGDQDGEQM